MKIKLIRDSETVQSKNGRLTYDCYISSNPILISNDNEGASKYEAIRDLDLEFITTSEESLTLVGNNKLVCIELKTADRKEDIFNLLSLLTGLHLYGWKSTIMGSLVKVKGDITYVIVNGNISSLGATTLDYNVEKIHNPTEEWANQNPTVESTIDFAVVPKDLTEKISSIESTLSKLYETVIKESAKLRQLNIKREAYIEQDRISCEAIANMKDLNGYKLKGNATSIVAMKTLPENAMPNIIYITLGAITSNPHMDSVTCGAYIGNSYHKVDITKKIMQILLLSIDSNISEIIKVCDQLINEKIKEEENIL